MECTAPYGMPSWLRRLLEVDTTATPADIKAAFRKKALALHPDVSSAPDATERFTEVSQAYGVSAAPPALVTTCVICSHLYYSLGPEVNQPANSGLGAAQVRSRQREAFRCAPQMCCRTQRPAGCTISMGQRAWRSAGALPPGQATLGRPGTSSRSGAAPAHVLQSGGHMYVRALAD